MKSPKCHEISAISCTPLNPTRAFTQFIVVSYWVCNTIEVFSVTESGFKSIYSSSSLPSLVTSLLLHNFGSEQDSKGLDYHPYLLAGLSDGSVATFSWQGQQLKDRKIISLGHAPVSLIVYTAALGSSGNSSVGSGKDGSDVKTVLAFGNRAIVFSHERNRLVHSPILLKVRHLRRMICIFILLTGVGYCCRITSEHSLVTVVVDDCQRGGLAHWQSQGPKQASYTFSMCFS